MNTPSNRLSDDLHDWNEVWQLILCSLAHLLFWCILIITLGLLADDAHADAEIGLAEVRHGSLLFKADTTGQYNPAPLLHTDATLDVSGMIVRARVRQEFKNEGDSWAEGVYVFPLPEDAAVDHMRMEIGSRIIEAKIKERKEARRSYAKAKQEGKKAALIEQERPNLFTNSVANIGPHESITIEIEYQQVLRYDAGQFSLRIPLAITPRYIPGAPLTRFAGSGWALDTTQVPDASRITPPVREGEGKLNSISLNLNLNAGLPIAKLDSPYHAIMRRDVDIHQGIAHITLADEQIYADRDFVLRWTPAAGQAPKAALFCEQVDAEFYYFLMVLPPKGDTQRERKIAQTLSREVIYIIDTSGSMGVTSIRQAKQALLLALDRLRPGDRFNVISFSSTTDPLFNEAVPTNRLNLLRARTYIKGLKASGGTEMYPALQAALRQQPVNSRVRQVIFLTDGSVGNETALFNLIHQRLGDSRLFTVGIGSAPNSHFMAKAAELGRGTFTYIDDVSQVQKQMAALFQKLESPMMTDLRINSGNATIDAYPPRIPDLYKGEPLIITFKGDSNSQQLLLSGKRQQQIWKNSLQLNQAASGKGISTLWARNKIDALMNAPHTATDKKEIKQEVVNVALQHHLVSKYTSLVAVDVTPSRPNNEGVDEHAMPVNLPHGQVYEKIFGRHAQTATTAPLNLMLGALLLLSAVLIRKRKQA